MKRGNLDKWTNVEQCKNLLFYSQLVNELLFDYSIPSNRIATLNSHFLCYDALNAINGIDRNGVPEGTLKPIIEELYDSLKKDPVFENAEDNPLKFFVKYQNDRYRKSTNISELNYDELKNIIIAINSKFFLENQYFEVLKEKIIEIIKKNDCNDQPKLFRVTKSLLTELINYGYSIQYIQAVMTSLFWNPKKVIGSTETIQDFFNAFDFEKKEYTVVFIVNKYKIDKLVKYFEGFELKDFIEQKTTRRAEKTFLGKNKGEAFLCINTNAFDQYSAVEAAIKLVSANSAFYRLYDHSYRYSIEGVKCGVYGNNDFYVARPEKSGVAHTKIPSMKQLKAQMDILDKAINFLQKKGNANDFLALLHAVSFHGHSLDSSLSENQLLDMWAIIESVLNISNKHTSDRINQVCIYLIPILKRQYLYSLFLQLADDIKNYSEEKFFEIVGKDDCEKEVVKSICKFTILEEFEEERNKFINQCEDFPLLKERIQYYSQAMNNSLAIYQFVEKHAERVKWQVMRIYRNRNLIIHNGKTMPYLDLLIENLHAYIDDFFKYVIESFAEKNTLNGMRHSLFADECEWVDLFSQKKRPMDDNLVEKILMM